MKVLETGLSGVLLIEPRVHGDERGFFKETYHERRYAGHGIPAVGEAFVQDNYSRSARGVLRGLHFQRHHPQGKLVQVVLGSVFDVVVDIRPGSSTFGRWYGIELSAANHRQLWVPPGMAHGFCVLSDIADFQYKCTDFYRPDDEGGIAWDDPDLAIAWPIEAPLLSDKDRQWPRLVDVGLDGQGREGVS